jgi:uncharacterized protein YdeI (YjbR/CyaY-like superfamily)
MISEIEDYYQKGCGRCDRFNTADCSTRLWTKGLSDLRRICLDTGLQETVKWGHPCFMHANRNIVIIGAFRSDFRLSFFNAALMKDPAGVLEKQGPNTAHPDRFRFTTNSDVEIKETTIRSYLEEAMEYARKNIKPVRNTSMPDFPDELTQALKTDHLLAEAFHALTPGRQKSYLINLNAAAKPETRVARIIKFREKILSGKGATER